MSRNALKAWVKSFFWVITSSLAFIAYASRRDWLLNALDNNLYYLGFFEGICSIALVFYLADKYGDAIDEIYLGIRELGSQRKKREAKE